ncbi:MAG: hypothetical protein CMA86_07405 [Euryarchaeota archaeon]|nr:hypothetical protein [Euryarchaeota archaeon]
MTPVAAIVCILLGCTSLLLLKRSPNRGWIDQMGGMMLGWIILFMGLGYAAKAVREALWETDVDLDFFRYTQHSFGLISIILGASFTFFYPYPIMQKASRIKTAPYFVGVLSLILIVTMLLLDYRYMGAIQILYIPGFIILISVYFRFLTDEINNGDETARRLSFAAGLIIIALHGAEMTWWLAQLISINDEFIGRSAIASGVGDYSRIPTWIGYNVMTTIGAVATLTLAAGETWRAQVKGMSGFTIIIYLILGVGLISGIADYAVLDIVNSCMYTVCNDFPESYNIWYTFTTDALVLLFTPLISMYVLLNFDVVDSGSEENRWLTRIIVILMLLIISSTMIELLQSFLPVSQMISSAILAMVVAIFIGWEERIMQKLIEQGESISKKLSSLKEINEPDLDTTELDFFSKAMASLLVFTVILCFLYSSIT